MLPTVRDVTESTAGYVDSLSLAIDIEHALKLAEEEGIVTWKEVQTQLNKVMFTSYDAWTLKNGWKVEFGTPQTPQAIIRDYLADELAEIAATCQLMTQQQVQQVT